jgi:hypothetical protein
MLKYSPAVLALSKFLHEVADMPPRGGWVRGNDTMKRAATR